MIYNLKTNEKGAIASVGIYILLSVLVLLVVASFALYQGWQINNESKSDTLFEGIIIDGVNVSNLTMSEARSAVKTTQEIRNDNITLTVNWSGGNHTFTSDDMGILYNTEEVLDAAWRVGRVGDSMDRSEEIEYVAINPVEFSTKMDVILDTMEKSVRTLVENLYVEPTDAAILSFDPLKPEGQRFTYAVAQQGTKADPEIVWQNVKREVEQRTWGEVTVDTIPIPSEISVEDLAKINQKIINFPTQMRKAPEADNRSFNVNLACETISGTVLMPGQTFSFNETVGKRSRENGYKEALGIVGGDRLSPTIGGGICQVSGTLYNAVIAADLDITEWHPHSLKSSYLYYGKDATVDWGSQKDFAFKNNTDLPLYIAMWTEPKEGSSIYYNVVCEIYGKPPLPEDEYYRLFVDDLSYISPPKEVKYSVWSELKPGETYNVSAKAGKIVAVYQGRFKLGDDKTPLELIPLQARVVYSAVQGAVYYCPSDDPPTPEPSPSPTATVAPDATADPNATVDPNSGETIEETPPPDSEPEP